MEYDEVHEEVSPDKMALNQKQIKTNSVSNAPKDFNKAYKNLV